jgi:asparagine synthase (glutamine-hydrolysing)
MCGIAGFILKQPSSESTLSLVRLMTDAIAHRGPDDEGAVFIHRASAQWRHVAGPASHPRIQETLPSMEGAESWIDAHQPDLALSHRRFAIIDRTANGHQPFWDREQRVCVVFNGEIYNYLEVRAELEMAGRGFRTTTDTEVLVEAYRAWGDRCFEKLNGMWAVALYDFIRRELILCRDRTGERPLYWVRRPEGIYFASEIRALLASDAIYPERRVHDEVVTNFLYQATSDLDENTFFRGIESVPIATVVRIGMNHTVKTRRYWHVPESQRSEPDEKMLPRLCEELFALLRDSVALRLRADVPVNVALSGGMDSSSVVAMAAALRGSNVDTYTVCFDETEWNEWPFAAAVAERFGVRNVVVDPPSAWVWEHLDRFVRVMEEPFHAPDLLPDHIIRHMLAARGFKVSLSGIGGDELFAGYEYYRRLRALDLKRAGNPWGAAKELVFASDTIPARAAGRLLLGKYRAMRRRWNPDAPDRLLSQALTIPHPPRLRQLPQACEERLRADIEWSLLPYWLRAGDKSSMAVPIEVRYPFLDHRLIEFAARLPVSYLIRDGWLKWILRKAMENTLPRQIAWRRKKLGFPFPISPWLMKATDGLRSIFAQMDNPYLSHHFWTSRLPEAIRTDPWLVWRALSFELWHRHFIRHHPVLPESLMGRIVTTPPGAACYGAA